MEASGSTVAAPTVNIDQFLATEVAKMNPTDLAPTAVPPLAFELPAPDISAWRAGNTGTEGVWHFDSG
eukprot:gene50667-67832_t